MATKITTGLIESGAITSALITDASITADDLHTTLDLTGKTVTVATATAGDNDTSVASTAFVATAIANLADSAPETLNTLNELAAALGDDASFSTTVTNSIAAKLPLAGGTMTGALIVVDGSTSSPSIGNSGDTDTGIYFPANDQMGLVVGGSQKLLINSTGLTVNNGYLTIGSGGVDISGTDELRYRMLNNGTFKGGIEVATTNGDMITTSVVDDLAIRSQANILFSGGGNTESLRLNSTGGIISRSTGANYATGTVAGLFVDGTGRGTVRIRSEADAAAELFFDVNGGISWDISARQSSENYDLHFYNRVQASDTLTGVAGPTVVFTQTGNVGIGETVPVAKLHIQGSGTSGQVSSSLILENSSSGTAGLQITGAAGSSHLDFMYAGGPGTGTNTLTTGLSMTLEGGNAGNVGIGTSSPDYLLDIENTSGNAIARLHSGTNGSSSLRLQNDAQHWDVNLQTNDKFAVYDHTAGTQPFTIMPTTGNVGIGTSSPDSRLHVYNNSANNYSTSIRLGQSYNTAYSQISSNFGGSMTINAGQGGGTPIMYLQVNGAEKARLSGTTTGRLYVSGTSRGRIVTQNETTGDGDDNCGAILASDYSSWSSIFSESWLGGSNGWGTFWAGSSGALYRRVESDTNPNEYVLVGSGSKRFTFDLDVGGNAFFDGTLTQNSYDYAEYFEWEDGNPDNEERRGFTVVLTDAGLIRKATSDDDPEEIMGAISGTAAVLGDAAMYDWDGKYEIDEWGTRILDDVVTISWTEEDENGESINHSYKETEVPSGVIVPEDAGRKEHKEYRLTADYDPEQEYVPRDKRPEWGIVGLLGKVRIRDESPKNPRWKYIKTIAGKKLWLIR
jgi:hypothetical protein